MSICCALGFRGDTFTRCLTWTFFRATDVLSNRYLARYTSLNWPRPIFFSIWKLASELWPISGCNGFCRKRKNKCVNIYAYTHIRRHAPSAREKTNSLQTFCNNRVFVIEVQLSLRSWKQKRSGLRGVGVTEVKPSLCSLFCWEAALGCWRFDWHWADVSRCERSLGVCINLTPAPQRTH